MEYFAVHHYLPVVCRYLVGCYFVLQHHFVE